MQVKSQKKQQKIEEQFINILSNGNIFSSKWHLKWNPIPYKNFLTREFANRLSSFNDNDVTIHSLDSNS
jgi:hypothetical protein